VGFFVQERGIESVKRLYEQIAYDLDSQGGIPVAMHAGCEAPPITEEKLNELRQLLWNFAKQMIAVGHPVEHVAQAYFQFFLKTAEHAARGETWMAKLIIADALQFLRSA
jgi:hypothetical protein